MNIQAWRIIKEKHVATAFDGEGARLFGGRWNSRGVRVVYTSSTLSLATLESLVHLTPPVSFRYIAIPIDFDAALVETVSDIDLPIDWTDKPSPPSTKQLGDQWVASSRSAVLKIPSVIIPTEANYLLNPAHVDYKKITIGQGSPFSFDTRLV